MVDTKFNLKLITEFDVSVSDPLVVEWIEKLELVCQLCGTESLEHSIPMRLIGGAFVVYQQPDDEAKAA